MTFALHLGTYLIRPQYKKKYPAPCTNSTRKQNSMSHICPASLYQDPSRPQFKLDRMALPRRFVPGCFFIPIDDCPPINRPAACASTPLGASSPLNAQQIVPPRCFVESGASSPLSAQRIVPPRRFVGESEDRRN